MTATLLASQCPAVQVLSASVYLNTSRDTTARVAKNVPADVDFLLEANQNAAMLDQVARYGAGLIGVPEGPTKITLSVPGGASLLLPVSAGHGMIGGPVEIAAATTVPVLDNTARIWLWLQQSGGVTPAYTTAPPAGEVCLLGSCATSGGSIISVDTSGVMYLRGGIGWRETADLGPPSDTPPAGVVFFSVTATGTYLWDGGAWRQCGSTGVAQDSIFFGDALFVGDRQQAAVFDSLTVYGTAAVFGKLRVI